MLNGTVSIERVVSGIKHWFYDSAFLKKIYSIENVIDTEALEDVIYEIENSYVEDEKEEKEIIEIYRNLYGVVINRLQEEFKSNIHNEDKVSSSTHNDYLCRIVFKLMYYIEKTGCSHLFPDYIIACKNMLLLNAPLDMLVKAGEDWKNDANFMKPLTGNINTYKIINDIVKERYLQLGLEEYKNVLNSKCTNLNSLMLEYRIYRKIYGDSENVCSFSEYQEDKKQEALVNTLKR